MRIALLGWDLNREAIDSIARLGVEIVAFTRWFPDEAEREAHPGWLEVRCPHQLGGGPRDEAAAFGVGVVRTASTSGPGFDFDVIHALDWRSRPAAGELASRTSDGALVVASERAEEEDSADSGFGPLAGPDAWIADHPWGAERLRVRLGRDADPVVATVPTQEGLAYWSDQEGPRESSFEGPCAVLALASGAPFSARTLIEGLRSAREKAPDLVAAVFGTDARCDRLRRLLKREGLLSIRWGDTCTPGTGRWNGAVSQSALVATTTSNPVDDPIARTAWLLGAPVVPIRGRDPLILSRDMLDAIFDRERREVDVRLALTLEGPRIEADGVAAEWLKIYLRLLDKRRTGGKRETIGASKPNRDALPMAFPELRSRLTLNPISTREAMASWTVRPDDWRSALEWLGPEAVRAVLTIRLFDVTDLAFTGLNAHSTADIEVGLSETHRTIALPFDGRSMAACLGVRSRWGYFHPLTHARICHLPREGLAPEAPFRRLRVMPRRPGI